MTTHYNVYCILYIIIILCIIIMKIAICFSGAIRSFKTCYPSIYKSIIQPLNPDIFMHLWSFGSDINKHKNNDKYKTYHKLQNDECDIDYILKTANPIKCIVENYSEIWEDKILNGCNGYEIIKNMNEHDTNYAISAMGMYFKIYEANKLKTNYEKENNFKYDIVIRARLDFFWDDNFCIENFHITETDILVIKDSYCTRGKWEGNDKFFVCTSNTMDKMCELYNNINFYYTNKICVIEGQNLNKYHIKQLKLTLKYIGDLNTYIKYTGRHRTYVKNRIYYIHNCLTFIGFNLCETFLQHGFQIVGYDKIDSTYKQLNKNVLDKYAYFTFSINFIEDLSTYNSCIIINDETSNNLIKHPNKVSIISNNDYELLTDDYNIYNNIKDVKNKFFLFNIYGERSYEIDIYEKMLKNKGDVYNKLLYIKDACQYIFHIIYNKDNKNSYFLVGNELDDDIIYNGIGSNINILTKFDLPEENYVIIETKEKKKSFINTLNWIKYIKNI